MSKFTKFEKKIRKQLREGKIPLEEVMRTDEYMDIRRDFQTIGQTASSPNLDGLALACWIRLKARDEYYAAKT